jgi:ABC-type sugar transport system substrate-binding protein
MKQGYDYAAKKLNVDVIFGSTPTENAEEQQLSILEGWLNQGGFDGFIVTPFRATSLDSALTTATSKKIPIINIDELIPPDAAKKDGIELVTQIASNNVEAGQLQAGLVLKLVPKGSEVAVIEGAPGTTSSIDRVTGFTRTAAQGGLKVVASQPANWDRAKSYDVATNILQSNPGVKAIFAANDDMGLGAVRAVQAAGLKGQVIVVSVDGTQEAIAAIKDGLLTATVAQFPDAMAFLAVKAMIDKLDGKSIEPKVDSPVKLITKDNTNEAGKYYPDE